MAAKTGKTKPEADKPKKPVASKDDTGKGTELVTIKANAMSVEIGPAVIANLSAAYATESKANALLAEVEKKRYDSLASLTNGVLKAAKNDDSIDLSVVFKDDKKEMSKLNDQLGLALGFREVYSMEVGGKQVEKIGTAKAVAKFFPSAKDKKGSAELQQKATIRSNFLHMLKKCAQAASGILADGNIEVKTDKETGTLQLSGPSIEKKFGQGTVLLNEKLTVGDGDNKKKLKEKPSFTAIANMGAQAAGKVLQTRKDSRVASGAVDPTTALVSICNSLVSALSKIEKPEGKALEALKAAQSAIAGKLKA